MNNSFTLTCDVCDKEKYLQIDEGGIPLEEIIKFTEKHEYHMSVEKLPEP